MINKRKKQEDRGNDLLGILLKDETFQSGSEEEIVDECILFFLAGSQTIKSANVNLMCYLMMNEKPKLKLYSEL